MWLSDIAFGFQHRHVIADCGRRDSQVMAFHQGFGADRFLGCNEVGDDGTQHLKATLVGASHRLLTSLLTLPDRLHFTFSAATDRHLAGVCRWSGGVCPD
ncbi:Uncharacterised protein [Mycobacterium tuberculosis]|nr:Uncharacterised protein [Mycobacterium tuberculosis]COX73179.1 Uncharacterised protein [Mycobacterium tuberculosis]